MKNIILTGMPGSGKSTVGVVLAKALNREFIDTDLLFQKKYNMPLQKILELYKITKFKKMEEEILLSVNTENCVIATGGSAIFCDKGMTHLKENGTCVYIKVPVYVLEKRINNFKSRGIAAGKGDTLDSIFAKRRGFYDLYSDITVEYEARTLEEVVEKIIFDLHQYSPETIEEDYTPFN